MHGLADSKKLPPEKRERLFRKLEKLHKQGKVFLGIGVIDAHIIDEVGIREANRRAMEIAIREMGGFLQAAKILIDGRDNYSFDFQKEGMDSRVKPKNDGLYKKTVTDQFLSIPKLEYVVRGDSKIRQIMAASIIAKVTRDRIMREYDGEFFGYWFAQHKWYGTQKHGEALEQLGVCEIHRRSYQPVEKIAKRDVSCTL